MRTCNCSLQNGNLNLTQNDLWRASIPTTTISWQQVGIGKMSRIATIVWLKAHSLYHRYTCIVLQLSNNNKFTFTVGMPTWTTHYCRHPHKDIWAARGCLPQFSLQLALTSHQQKACSISSFTHYLNELKKLQVAQAKQVQFQSAVCFRETGSLIPA